MEKEARVRANLETAVFAHVVEQAVIAIRQATDEAGLRFFIRPDLTVLAHAIREALQKAIDARATKPRFDLEIQDFDRMAGRSPFLEKLAVIAGGKDAAG